MFLRVARLAMTLVGVLLWTPVRAAPSHAPVSPRAGHAASQRRGVPILPLADVRPGMVGHGLTVFRGTKPERFNVRVISVLRNFLPKQDVILVRAEDPRLDFSGIVAGMSGSPVYIDGKLMGALAYAWNFSKEPLAGVTPIESMLAEGHRPRHRALGRTATEVDGRPPVTGFAEGGDPRERSPGSDTSSPSTDGNPPRRSGTRASADSELRPATLALTISGASGEVVADFAPDFTAMGLQAVHAGGGRTAPPPSTSAAPPMAPTALAAIEPGSAVGVELIRGDMSAVATGTVTYVDGNDVLAFGHPMMGAGEIYLPLVEAEIHAILPSVSQSFKLSSPIREVGSLVQDRQACIVGDLGVRTSMIPAVIRVHAPKTPPRSFAVEIARDRRLTPTLLALVASSAVTDAEPTVTDVMLTIASKVWARGLPPLVFEDQLFSNEGVSKAAILGSRGVRAVSDLLFNPFEPVVVERIEMNIALTFHRDVSEIVALAAPGGRIRAGATVPLRVTLRPFAGAEYSEIIPVVIPGTAAAQALRIEVASGALARPDVAPPESLRGYVENLQKAYSPLAIVVSLARPDDGAALRGRLLPSLPGSALDTLRPASQARRTDGYRITERIVHPTQHLIVGKQEVSVWVSDDALADGKN